MQLICLTGPESSGKTSLAKILTERFRGVWLPEYARSYLTRPEYDTQDLFKITREQRERELSFVNSEPTVGFLDTDLINIRIWWDVRVGSIPQEIDNHLRSQAERGYLLLRGDLPWEYDELRDPQLDREALFERHRETLEQFGFKYLIVDGQGEARIQNAVCATNALLELCT